MQNCKSGSYLLLTVIAALALISAASIAAAQNNDRPWMNPSLSPAERADLVLKQLTLDEKLALLHGNGMAHAPQWQMPMSNLTNGGAGYVEGVKRLGIPPLVISDAGYGVRDSGANGRYSTAMPSSLGAAASWDPGFSLRIWNRDRQRAAGARIQHDSGRRSRSGPRTPQWAQF